MPAERIAIGIFIVIMTYKGIPYRYRLERIRYEFNHNIYNLITASRTVELRYSPATRAFTMNRQEDNIPTDFLTILAAELHTHPEFKV